MISEYVNACTLFLLFTITYNIHLDLKTDLNPEHSHALISYNFQSVLKQQQWWSIRDQFHEGCQKSVDAERKLILQDCNVTFPEAEATMGIDC